MTVQTVSAVNPIFPVVNQDNDAAVLTQQFATIKKELELIFAAINGGTNLSSVLSSIAALSSVGTLEVTAGQNANTYTVTTFAKSLVGAATAAAAQAILNLGSAATQDLSFFATAGHNHTIATLPPMTGASGGGPGTAGYVPAPQAGDNLKFLTGAATYTGLQGTVSGAITGGYQLYSQPAFDNPRMTFLDNGNSGASKTINISTAQFQRVTLNAVTPTLTFTNFGPANTVLPLVLEVVQDGTGSRVPTLAGATFKYIGAAAPVWSTGASKKDIVCIYSPDGGSTAILSVAGFDFR